MSRQRFTKKIKGAVALTYDQIENGTKPKTPDEARKMAEEALEDDED